MKLSVQTSPVIEKLGVKAGLKAIKDAGFDGVDLNLDVLYPGGDIFHNKTSEFFDSREQIEKYIKEVNEARSEYGIEILQCHGPFPIAQFKPDNINDYLFETLVKSIEICARVGCNKIVVHPAGNGSARYPTPLAEEWRVSMNVYERLIPTLKKYRVICCLENMWKQDWRTKLIYAGICDDMKDVCEHIDKLNKMAGEELFGFCLDTGHLLLVGADIYDAVMTLGKRLKAFHIHDNDGVNDQHITPYLGRGNWDRFCLAVHDSGYRGSLSFETSNTINVLFCRDELIPMALRMTRDMGVFFNECIASMNKK